MTVLTCPPVEYETPVGAPVDASLANFFARPHPECGILSLPKLTVWLDHTDRVISLPSAWNSFAAITGFERLDRNSILGRPVGWFIEDETVRECFRLLLGRTRRERRAAKIVSRCDGPEEPRAMQIKLAPMSAGAIECSWSFLHGAAAEEIAEVRRRRFCDGEHVRMCSWCQQVHVHNAWQRLEAAAPALGLLDHDPLPPITHGICQQCSASLLAENAAALPARVAV